MLAGPGSVHKRPRAVVVVPSKRLPLDLNDLTASYSLLALYRPWRIEGEWLSTDTSSRDAVFAEMDSLDPNIRAMIARINRMEQVEEDAWQHHEQAQQRDQTDEHASNGLKDPG